MEQFNNELNNIWMANPNFRKPNIFWGVYNNQYFVTISDSGPIFYFTTKVSGKSHIFCVVANKCTLVNFNGVNYYQIADTQDDINLNKQAIVPVGCTDGKYSPLEHFVVDNLLIKFFN